jgi:UDP-3-O-[3-hydroxymyristoyl] glucosamine N-acyltransferase
MSTEDAVEDAVTFVTKPKYFEQLAKTRAGAVMLCPEFLTRDEVSIPAAVAVIAVARPYVAFARAAQALARRVPAPVGIHRSAVIEEGAILGRDVAIGPFVYVGSGARVGDGAVLYAGVHVEAHAEVGAGSVLYNHVVIRHGCLVGARCILHPGVVIGSDGFGFAQDGCRESAGGEGDGAPVQHVKIPQLGDVRVEDEVEIGANSCVDRAALGTTRIGAGTKIDNLVQVGHNVQIGPGCILVAQSGVAGSSRLGRSVILGAQSGISGHVEVGDHATVYGQSGVMENVAPGGRVMGSPSTSQAEHFRNVVLVAKLDSLYRRVKKLERALTGADGACGSETATETGMEDRTEDGTGVE